MNFRHFAVAALIGCAVSVPTQPWAQTHTPGQGGPPPVIDMHMHAHFPPHYPAGAPSICRPAPCEGEGQATATSADALRRTLAQMDRYNIQLGLVSGLPETVREWKQAAPERFMVSPFLLRPGNPSPEALRRAYEAGQFQFMGEIGTQLSGVPPNDPALEPYFALAEELDLPVLIHMEGIGPYVPTFRVAAGDPALLEDVLIRHPKLRIYVENAGYPNLSAMVSMMYQYPQLYADLSTISWVIPREAFYDYLRGLVRAGLGKRLMFGSDQMRWPEKIGEAIAAIQNADFLTEGQKRDILYNNAARFLRLDAAAGAAR